ncbi:prolyl endopeptidase-like [Littorina saxatilis]
MGKFDYPHARRDETVVDDYHGTKIVDAYRWLEDPDSEETKAFVDAQNDISKPFLEGCPVRKKIIDRITEVWDYPKYTCPSKKGEKYYYFHNSGLQNQSVYYVQDTVGGKSTVFFDPNKLSTEGTIALRGHSFTDDGSLWAYSLSESGSDWVTIKFKKAPSAEDLPDVLKNVKFTSMAWTPDNDGLFYNRYPEQDGKADGTETTTNLHHKLYYHRLGTQQSEDVLVAEVPQHPRWMVGAEVSDCGGYLLLTPREGCEPANRLYVVNLTQLKGAITGKLEYTVIVDNFDAEYEYISNKGSVFTFKTNLKAPRYKLINIDFSKPEPENWVTLIDEDETAVLEWASCVNRDKLVLHYLHHVKSELFIYDYASGSKEFQIPLEVGSIIGYTGDYKDTEIFFKFMSFLTPGVIYQMDMKQPYEPKVYRTIEVQGFDASNFETEQKFFPSKDGTKIPMFIVHKKGLQRDGSHPVLLYGYGGFSVSITPSFSPSRTVYLQNLGGVFAVANIRGGNEYGDTWHKAGTLGNKQNGFDDFQAAAQFLVDSKYTTPNKIIINGGSNGGLLVGACLNQRPDLFGAGIAQVGVLDMLRFHKFTIGHAWITDYGSSDDPKPFQWLIKYSPLHNIPREPKGGQYSSLLLMTGDHDDRVVPLHSLKFIAELQHTLGKKEGQTNPLIIRVDTDSGHGAGKPTKKVIEEIADMYCFICQTVGLVWTD